MDAELYEQHAHLEQDHWWFVARRSIVQAVLDRHLPARQGRRILDVGCGTGGMLPLLSGFGTVTGLEPERLAVEHCRAAFPGFDVHQGKVPDDVPTDGSFDVVTAFDVIEHIDDDTNALVALGEALAPGGTVVLTVPALQWLWSDHDEVNGHHRRYSRTGLMATMDRAGLQVRHASYFNTVLLPIVMAARLSQRLRRTAIEPHSDFSMPPPVVNRVLRAVMSGERRAVARPGMPIGVTLVVTATVAR